MKKNKPLSTLEQVWAVKRAVEEETRGLTGRELFAYIRKQVPDLGLPIAAAHTRASRQQAAPPARRWRASAKKKLARRS